MKIADGKTKTLFVHEVSLKGKDVVTWGNEHHAPMLGKAVWATRTTKAMFSILKQAGLDVAYTGHDGSDGFIAPYLTMIKFEVVGRWVIEAEGSYAKRHPNVPTGVKLEKPIVEFFLKSSDRKFGEIDLPCDDPYVARISEKGLWVHDANLNSSEADWVFIPASVFGYDGDLLELDQTLRMQTALIADVLWKVWARIEWKIGDFKVEFGINRYSQILLGDVLDNDSWRLRDETGRERSKQTIRTRHKRGDPLDEILAEASKNYALVARKAFEIQRIDWGFNRQSS